MVDISHHVFGGNEIEAEIPRALKRKISYLRAVFKQLPISSEITEGYLALLDQIEISAEARHDIIHGAVTEYVERSGEAEMVRVIRHRGGIEKKKFRKTTKEILNEARNAQCLGGEVLKWATEFYDLTHGLLKQRNE